MRCLSLLLSFVISVPFAPLAGAQTGLKISLVIVEGEGAINNVRQRTARQPIVQVEDENHKPIAGAAVLFTLPTQGAGGTFAGGAHTLTVMTDKNGRASTHGFRPNAIEGQFLINVSASYLGQTASAVISQGSVALAGAAGAAGATGATAGAAASGARISGKLIAILAVGAAAVAAGVIAATRGGQATVTTTPTTTVTPGTGTVGPPR
jgi:hypothetical protein